MDLKRELTFSDLVPKRIVPKRPAKAYAPEKRESAPAEIVGLRIGSTSLTAAQVVNNGGKSLVRFAGSRLPTGIVTGGEVRDAAGLGSALSEFFAANELPRRGIRLGLGNSRIGVRTIEVAGMESKQQLENVIGFRAHEMLSMPIDESLIDYHILSTATSESGEQTHEILVVVAYRESVERYLAATDLADLQLAGIDLEAFALLRAAAPPRAENDALEAALVVLSVEDEQTTLAISDGCVCQFTRVLDWSGANIASALARTLGVSAAEAHELIDGLSLVPGHGRLEGLTLNRVDEALAAVRYELQTLGRELLSSLRFYQSQPGSLAIGEVTLAGSLADLPGFATELEGDVDLRIALADPFLRVSLADDVPRPERAGALAVAVGLGIED